MTDDKNYEEGRKVLKDGFEERKAFNKRNMLVCERKRDSAIRPQVESHWALGKLTFQQFEDVYDNFEKLFMNLSEKLQSVDHRIENLEESIDKIAKETNVDISNIQKEVAVVKSTLQSPLFNDVVNMFKEGKTEAEKSKKRGEETLDNLTRSH
jgi:uncharacterized protein YdcH (DUF465 family)